MEKELVDFVRENSLSPLNKTKVSLRSPTNSVFKTKDAKEVHSKILSSLSGKFVFPDTSNFLLKFPFSSDRLEIARRQEFFRSIPRGLSNSFLKGLQLQRTSWKPPYSIVVVTEDETTYVQLKKMGCPVKILLNERDVMELQEADIVQVIDCEGYSRALETLPQTIFLKNVDDAYLERHVELLSQWANIISVVGENKSDEIMAQMAGEISSLFPLLEKRNSEKLTRDRVEEGLENIKDEISAKVREMTVTGNSLIEVISRGAIPQELKAVVKGAIASTNLPEELFLQTIPVQIDEAELEKVLRKQDINEFTGMAEKIKERGRELSELPRKLKILEERLLIYDFYAGVSQWMGNKNDFPEISERVYLENAENLFLDKPQPITFNLDSENRCSILTGANSGGKTTLLEHILQAISCLQLGLPFPGRVGLPLFSEVYYFAKSKGSMSKGAFETLLTQMSEISPGASTLILADEIEAVTEPGVAGKMISATAQYFINKKCYLVIATHLGHEIQKNVPAFARIDGIEAKGLSEDNELIVDHNPLLGKLAHSTPELIIEKMVRTKGGDYFEFLHGRMRA